MGLRPSVIRAQADRSEPCPIHLADQPGRRLWGRDGWEPSRYLGSTLGGISRIYYQYRHDRARRTLRGIDEQVKKAEQAVAGKAPVKRNRFIQLSGGARSVNRDLEAKARTLAGIKGYITNLRACPDGAPVTADFVVSSYHQLFEIEKSFRMSKHDLQARPQ